MNHAMLFGLMACLGIAIAPSETFARKWTDKTGKFSVEADFVSIANGAVSLKRQDGQVIKIPLENLSETDQEVARAVAQARATPRDAQNPFVPTKEQPESAPTKNDAARPVDTREPSPPQSEPKQAADAGVETAEDLGTLRRVIVTGLGTTEKEARQSAFHNAVEQAIGVLVDATTVVNNDQVLSDKVLTYSNGYIESYKVLFSGKANGLINVKIAAQVKVQALSEKLQSLSISVRQKVDGSSLAAAAVTKAKRDQDAATMLAEVFQGFPANCLELTTGPLKIGTADVKGKTDLTVPVTVTVDAKRYKAFDTAIRNLLGKMAVQQKSYPLVPSDLRDVHNGSYPRFTQPDGISLYSFLGLRKGLSEMHFGTPRDDPVTTFGVALYEIDRSSSRKTYWTVFELNDKHFGFFRTRCRHFDQDTLNMSVRLLDAGGKALEEEEFVPAYGNYNHGWHQMAPRRGTNIVPSVILVGVNCQVDFHNQVFICLDLMNPGMTDAESRGAWDRIVHNDSTRCYRGLFPIAPFFCYRGAVYHSYAYSPEVRFAVTFKGVEVSTVEKVKKVDCTVSMPKESPKAVR